MLFCPECQDTFDRDAKKCPECNVELVESSDDVIEVDDDFVILCSLADETAAYIIQGFLESEGIPCQMENATFHASPAPVDDLVAVRLWCRQEDVVDGRRLIAEHETFTICPSCSHVVSQEEEACGFCGAETQVH
ncbi:MAG: hypothetical protein G3M78_01255 [Candidatus Nitrohelix vancouverensis]|uniref:DUF2007 domain-containing protein n=1 Tax=Candidatus Nitrohelix vancouverensis TaxID=2705534 RepID=A0A7T0C046_9BACT|nr:MAG: hypothetical protein G3M78_01255 [Candidatus Nitrohelix vancouverensis]